jgi:hypothetical protein
MIAARPRQAGQAGPLMTARFIVHVVAVIGWLMAALFAYAFLTLFGYFGVGFYGLLLLFICMQVELEPDRNTEHHQGSSGGRYALLFKILGTALTIVGFGGFLLFQLN